MRIVQSLGGTREVSIRLQPKDDPAATDASGKVNLDRISADVLKMLQAARPDAKLKSRDFVGPKWVRSCAATARSPRSS